MLRFITPTLLLAGLVIPPAAAQDLPSRVAEPAARGGLIVWGDLAALYQAQPLWLGARLGVGVERGPLNLRLSYTLAEDFWGANSLNAVGLSVGSDLRLGVLRLAASAGPTLNWGKSDEDYPAEQYLRAGAVGEAAVLFSVSHAVDLGVEGYTIVGGAFTVVGGGPAVRVKLGRW